MSYVTELKTDVFSADCPSRRALRRVNDKWSGLIISMLARTPHRFGELEKRVGGISQKMLAQTLRGLQEDGLVNRRVDSSTIPISVEYSLTELGHSLDGPLRALHEWAEEHADAIERSREHHRGGVR